MYTRGALVTFSLIACALACSPAEESSSNQQTRSQPVAGEMSQMSEAEEPEAAPEAAREREPKANHFCEPNEKGRYPDQLCSSIAKEFLGKLEREKPFKIACVGNSSLGFAIEIRFDDGWKRRFDGFNKPTAAKFAKQVVDTFGRCAKPKMVHPG